MNTQPPTPPTPTPGRDARIQALLHYWRLNKINECDLSELKERCCLVIEALPAIESLEAQNAELLTKLDSAELTNKYLTQESVQKRIDLEAMLNDKLLSLSRIAEVLIENGATKEQVLHCDQYLFITKKFDDLRAALAKVEGEKGRSKGLIEQILEPSVDADLRARLEKCEAEKEGLRVAVNAWLTSLTEAETEKAIELIYEALSGLTPNSLLAERDALKQRVAELARLSKSLEEARWLIGQLGYIGSDSPDVLERADRWMRDYDETSLPPSPATGGQK